MGNILEVRGLTKKFGGLNAVNDVNLRVQEGMRLGIIGPKGAGKTTLFSMIAGEIKPTSGFIQFAGKRIHGLKPHRISRMGIGTTFQLVRVFDELSVYGNALTGIIAQRLQFSPNIDRRNEVDRILELTYLQDRRDTLARNLTMAWKKRVCLATALATKPKLLLLDELMTGLTFVEIDETLTLLREINAEMGITLIVVEHVMRTVMELCEEILIISSGEKIASGTPQEIENNKRVIDVYLGEEKR